MSSLSQYIDLFDANLAALNAHAPALLNSRRAEARRLLSGASLPGKDNSAHPGISLDELFAPDFGVNISRLDFHSNAADSFRCGVPNVSTLLALVDGDSFSPSQSLLRNLPAGVTVCSLADAAENNPGLVERFLGSAAPAENPAVALNSLLLQDGVFIHVDKNVHLDKPVQIVNIFSAVRPMMASRRIIVALEQGASASVLVCDHSARPDVDYLSNQVVELFLAQDAALGYYEMEESSSRTRRLSQLFARQAAGSSLTVNGSTLSAGSSLNRFTIETAGDNTDTHLGGFAIASASQSIANITDVRHRHLHGRSRQMFKYLASDSAVASFFGIINVAEDARFTEALQTNRNIIASPDARIHTRPQLEIYCDEVKCNHGATIGQLDENAIFYMRSRGIPLHQARLMLMQAFMADIIDSIDIPALGSRLRLLVERRLCGDSVLCADCQVKDAGND